MSSPAPVAKAVGDMDAFYSVYEKKTIQAKIVKISPLPNGKGKQIIGEDESGRKLYKFE